MSLHGGYYDFVDCTFEKWTLDYKGSNLGKNSRFAVKNRFYWCWISLLPSLNGLLSLIIIITAATTTTTKARNFGLVRSLTDYYNSLFLKFMLSVTAEAFYWIWYIYPVVFVSQWNVVFISLFILYSVLCYDMLCTNWISFSLLLLIFFITQIFIYFIRNWNHVTDWNLM